MPYATSTASASAPVAATKDVFSAAARLGFTVPTGHEEDYLALLRGTDRAAQAVLAFPGTPHACHKHGNR